MKREYEGMEYELSYRNVKYARVDMREGRIILILPYGMSPEEVLKKHGERIRKKWNEIEKIKESARKILREGEVILLGERYRIEKNCENMGIDRQERIITICPERPDATRELIRRFLRARIERKVEKYSEITGLHPKKIFIREQITKWGSCSNRKNLSFNLRLAFTPRDFFDYIVLHEVLHLRHMNHGKEFKNELRKIYGKNPPDEKTMMKYWFRSTYMMEALGIPETSPSRKNS